MCTVGHFIDYIGYARGGAETNVEGLLKHNDGLKYKFEIVTSVTPFQRPKFHHLRVPIRTAIGFHQVREAAFLFKGKLSDLLYKLPGTIYKMGARKYFDRYNIIHCHGLDVMEALRDVGESKPIVLTVYNPVPERHLQDVAYADRIIVRSRELLSKLLEHFEEMKLIYIPPGCEFNYYRPPSEPGAGQPRTYPGRYVKLLLVGRLRPFKNIEGLLKAVQILNRGQVATSYYLTIVGDGPLRGRLVIATEDLGINDKVRFAGTVSSAEIGSFYHDADLIVVPSFYESFSQVSLETLVAQKRLLISTGMAEFRSLFPSIPVCNPYLPSDIASKIADTLMMPPVILPPDELEAYSWQCVMKQHYEIYDSLL